MNNRVQIINYKGEEIFYTDFSDLPSSDHKYLFDLQIRYLEESKRKKLLYLSNLTNTKLFEGRQKKKEFEKQLVESNREFKIAVFGVTEIQKVIVRWGENVYCSKTFETAKEWLVDNNIHLIAS